MEYWEQHNYNLSEYAKRINKIYDEAIKEIAKIAKASGHTLDEDFAWNDIPSVKQKLEDFLQRMNSVLLNNLTVSISAEWQLANQKNDELVKKYLKGKKDEEEKLKRYLEHNLSAMQAFLDRKERGMNLSERVWKLTEEFKKETEYGIAEVMRDGLKNGESAESLQRKVKQYLNEPNKIFRRVRDKETGELKPSRAMKDYHPGQGVYRSSRKNALRMTITETNMAFHEADKLRVQKLDFVLAIKVVLSNNHTCNGVPFKDICDKLQGVYPKDFHFIGWHPHCRCHVETILKTEETMEDEHTKKRNEWRKKAGLKPIATKGVKNEKPVTTLPQNYVKWREEYGGTPYWELSQEERASKYGKKNKSKSNGKNENPYRDTKFTYTSLKDNRNEIIDKLGIKGTIPDKMSFEEADNGNENIIKSEDNCVNCVAVHELRRRGINVTAKGFNGEVSAQPEKMFLTKEGKSFKVGYIKPNDFMKDFESQIHKGERYFVCWNDKSSNGHAIFVENVNGKIRYHDPQDVRQIWNKKKIHAMMKIDSVYDGRDKDPLIFNEKANNAGGVMLFRMDDKAFNLNYLLDFVQRY